MITQPQRIAKAYMLAEPLQQICNTIASRPPEAGGILLGPPDRDVVAVFIFDTEGSYRASGAWYTPHIPSLQRKVDELHEKHGYVIKGFIHSHPGAMRELSSGDLHTIRNYFNDEQPLPYFFAPIVWTQSGRPLHNTESDDFKLISNRLLSFHVIHPEDVVPDLRATVAMKVISDIAEAPPSCRPLSLHKAPVPANAATTRPDAIRPAINTDVLKSRLNACDIRQIRINHVGHELNAIELDLAESELILLLPTEFPLFPPHVMVTPRNGSPPFRLGFNSTDWKIGQSVSVEDRLVQLIERSLKKKLHVAGFGDKVVHQYGPADGMVVCTSNPAEAHEQGWIRHQSLEYEYHDLREQYFARSGGLLSRSLAERKVFIAGCGSGGSYIAEQLVRSGVGRLVLCDPDLVKFHNLCRSGYRVHDIEMPKVKALGRHLKNINPSVRLEMYSETIEALDEAGRLQTLIGESDLLIAGTDSPRAQKILGRYSYVMAVAALFPGLYERAQGGEILITWPQKKSPCYDCMLGFRGKERDNLRGNFDYATGTLVAEPGLSADIHHLDSITVKLALGLLLQDVPTDEPCETRDFVRTLSDGAQHRTYVLSGHAPGFWIFGQLYPDGGSHQAYAYQTLWLDIANRRRADCETCGDRPTPLHQHGKLDLSDLVQAPSLTPDTLVPTDGPPADELSQSAADEAWQLAQAEASALALLADEETARTQQVYEDARAVIAQAQDRDN